MTIHPAADIFPPMSEEEFRGLVDDIRQNGLHEAIWTFEGQVLDGRHRLRACEELGITPRTRSYTGDSPTVFALSLNLQRRHLTSSQKAVLAVEVLPMLEAEAKRRQGVRNDLNIPEKVPECSLESREVAADLFGTNSRYVSDAKRVQQAAPELFAQIKTGEVTLQDAKRTIKEQAREAHREENRALVEQAPEPTALTGVYSTIVIDPPWDWGDEGDQDQLGRARPTYATMTFDELLHLPVGEMADEDAHIYLWITNRSLPKGFALLEAWGFRYVTCLTWCKPSIGMGNYYRGSTEQVLFGVRGSLPLKRRDVGTWFEAPRPGRHSAKPPEFQDLIETCSPGPYLEMFARSSRDGWVSWGAEA